VTGVPSRHLQSWAEYLLSSGETDTPHFIRWVVELLCHPKLARRQHECADNTYPRSQVTVRPDEPAQPPQSEDIAHRVLWSVRRYEVADSVVDVDRRSPGAQRRPTILGCLTNEPLRSDWLVLTPACHAASGVVRLRTVGAKTSPIELPLGTVGRTIGRSER
jgi:hypothetical protein